MTKTCFVYYGVQGASGSGNQAADAPRNYGQAALYKGSKIGPNDQFGERFMWGFSHADYGSWQNVQHRYLGVKFAINGETHYGWIGFRSVTETSDYGGFKAIFGGWAYETQPNKPIRAGDTGTTEKAAASSGSADPTSLEMLATGHASNAAWHQRKSY